MDFLIKQPPVATSRKGVSSWPAKTELAVVNCPQRSCCGWSLCSFSRSHTLYPPLAIFFFGFWTVRRSLFVSQHYFCTLLCRRCDHEPISVVTGPVVRTHVAVCYVFFSCSWWHFLAAPQPPYSADGASNVASTQQPQQQTLVAENSSQNASQTVGADTVTSRFDNWKFDISLCSCFVNLWKHRVSSTRSIEFGLCVCRVNALRAWTCLLPIFSIHRWIFSTPIYPRDFTSPFAFWSDKRLWWSITGTTA